MILGRPSILFPARLSLASAKSRVSEDFSVCVILLFVRKDLESFFNCLFWLSVEYSPQDVEVPLSLSKTSDKSATDRTRHNFKSNPSLNLILEFSFSTSHFASASQFSPSIHVVYTYNALKYKYINICDIIKRATAPQHVAYRRFILPHTRTLIHISGHPDYTLHHNSQNISNRIKN